MNAIASACLYRLFLISPLIVGALYRQPVPPPCVFSYIRVFAILIQTYIKLLVLYIHRVCVSYCTFYPHSTVTLTLFNYLATPLRYSLIYHNFPVIIRLA